MTSSEGLLSLVNQLQNMETAMGLFLIETALKLSTFHDTKFLVMVDLPEGRKIAGKGEMIQCFLDGKLLPSPSDVKIELVPEVSALTEYPLRDMETSSCGLTFTNNLKQESRPFRPYSHPSSFRQPVTSSFDNPSPSAMPIQHRPASSFDASSRLMGMKSPKMATSACESASPKLHHQQQPPPPPPHQPQQQPPQHHHHHSVTPTAESPYGCGSAPMSPHLHPHQQSQQQHRKRQAYDPMQQPQGPSSLSSSPKAMKIEGRDEEEASVVGEDEDENLQSMYHEDHGGGGGDDYPIPAPVAHLGGGSGGGAGSKYSPFNAYQSYHQAELNSEDQTNRIAMAQQFSYDEVKAKDSTGFKIIASIVYAKAKELAADCPIADYKGPEVNNYLRQEYLAWFARTFPRLYDTKATALFRARMQICFQTIRKKLFPPPSQTGTMVGGGGGTSSSLLSIMPADMSAGNMGGTGYPDRNFGGHSLVNRREENHPHMMGSHTNAGQDRGGPEQHQHQAQQQQHHPPQRPHHQQGPSMQQHPQQQHHHEEAMNRMNPEREESCESASVDVKCHDQPGGSGGDGVGRSSSLPSQPDMNTNMTAMNMNSFDVGNERNDEPYPFGQC